MGKAKKDGQLPHRHLRARISYLYQAAAYIQGAKPDTQLPMTGADEQLMKHDRLPRILYKAPVCAKQRSTDDSLPNPSPKGCKNLQDKSLGQSAQSGQSHRFINHIRTIATKSQIRLSPPMKRSTCKKCDGLLIGNSTSINEVENKSRGGTKPWADVLVVTCNTCGTKKRFPIGAKRQPRRPVKKKQRTKEPNKEAVMAND